MKRRGLVENAPNEPPDRAQAVENPNGEHQTEWRIVLLDAANVNQFMQADNAEDAEIKIDTGEAEKMIRNRSLVARIYGS